MKKFKNWVRQFENEDNLLGDLTKDILKDTRFPDSSRKKEILSYLKSRDACNEALEAFNELWVEYTRRD
jgi:uncharacterized protein YozE (UPF0346 family)